METYFSMTELGDYGEPPHWLDFAIQHGLVKVVLAFSWEWHFSDLERLKIKWGLRNN